MKAWQKTILFQVWLVFMLAALAIAPRLLAEARGGSNAGFALEFLLLFLLFFWGWQWYAYAQYRHCRQEEFLFLVQTAAVTQAPLEQILRAYLADRPSERLFRSILLFFVFPGYYWIHRRRSFDVRLHRLASALEHGVPLDRALLLFPGIAARETALAAAVGQYSGKLGQAMQRIPEGRTAPFWLELVPRMLYPCLVMLVMASNVAFLMIFIVPKFEKIFLEFKMRLPYATELLMASSRWCLEYPLILLVPLLAIGLVNAWLFSSRVRWHFPVLGWLYRLKARGEFLQMLGIMLETGKPLHEILERMLESRLLPSVLQTRVAGLLADLTHGEPLTASLARHGLATAATLGLIESAQKTNKLPWALQELGDAMLRRSARLSQRAAAVAFPLMIAGCGALAAFVALSMFLPLIELLGGLTGG